jgi:hypothetical protein
MAGMRTAIFAGQIEQSHPAMHQTSQNTVYLEISLEYPLKRDFKV